MSVAEAVRRSMPITLFFAAVREADEVFVGSGVLENYPFRLLTAQNTLQSRIALDTPPPPKAYSEAKREKIENFFDYGWTLFQTLKSSQVNRHLESGDWHRTCTSKHPGWAQPSLISTTNPSATSRPPGEPVPKSISISSTRTPPTTGRRISVLGQELGQMGADDYLPAQ